jgi:hypothetical protein
MGQGCPEMAIGSGLAVACKEFPGEKQGQESLPACGLTVENERYNISYLSHV